MSSLTAMLLSEKLTEEQFASDSQLTEVGSGKFFVMSNGDSVVQNRGRIDDISIRRIQKYIKTTTKRDV